MRFRTPPASSSSAPCVCVFAAPTTFGYQGVNVPAGLTQAGFENWASPHGDEAACSFGFKIGPNSSIGP